MVRDSVTGVIEELLMYRRGYTGYMHIKEAGRFSENFEKIGGV